jgi:hypothetical protein
VREQVTRVTLFDPMAIRTRSVRGNTNRDAATSGIAVPGECLRIDWPRTNRAVVVFGDAAPLTNATMMSDIETKWTLNASSTIFSS